MPLVRRYLVAGFTLQKIFGTARVKMARVPKKKGSAPDKICSVNNLSVPNFIRAEPNFLPVLGPSARYYDQKNNSFFSLDFKTMLTKH